MTSKITTALARLADGRLLARHQLAAALATCADFAAMVTLVELAGQAPPVATVLSAITGGLVNFSLSRGWAFRGRHAGTFGSQAKRYAAVSLGGALLNGALLALVLKLIAVPYPIARGGVAFVIGILYTYPMHTRVVFRVAGAEP
jgi:putative flippase GtrA